jgi:hypothetical protein
MTEWGSGLYGTLTPRVPAALLKQGQAAVRVSHHPYVQHPPIKSHFTPVNLSLMHFTQDIQAPMNHFCTNTVKLTIFWCHMVTMARRGLTTMACIEHHISLLPITAIFKLLYWKGKLEHEAQCCGTVEAPISDHSWCGNDKCSCKSGKSVGGVLNNTGRDKSCL